MYVVFQLFEELVNNHKLAEKLAESINQVLTKPADEKHPKAPSTHGNYTMH
jgi:hypothetical protein